ncbi:MAG: hypothetical protein C0483_04050 [Pirellula sp.]|nr:hypothetical protein [Pirellula sp.]
MIARPRSVMNNKQRLVLFSAAAIFLALKVALPSWRFTENHDADFSHAAQVMGCISAVSMISVVLLIALHGTK